MSERPSRSNNAQGGTIVATITRALIAAVSAAVVVLGAQGTPQQYLNDAKQALDAISPTGLSPDAGKALTDLKPDFPELQTAFQDSIGAISAAPTRQPLTADWQRKYATVQTDLILADSPSSP